MKTIDLLEAEKKSSRFRSENGLSPYEPIHLQSLLLRKQVVTIFRPLENLSGMAVKCGDARFMLINQKRSLGHQHFTIAHEIYHLFIQENFTSQKCVTGLFEKQQDSEEKKADLFAACLLMPKDGMLQLIPNAELSKDKITLATVVKLEQNFSVSRKAILQRLKEFEIISGKLYSEYADKVKQSALRLGFPLHLYEHGNDNRVIGEYGTIAKQLFEEDKISESFYIELMQDIGIDPLANPKDEDEQ
jgi:Zn-dependent peptidase ImmA (M78 family)